MKHRRYTTKISHLTFNVASNELKILKRFSKSLFDLPFVMIIAICYLVLHVVYFENLQNSEYFKILRVCLFLSQRVIWVQSEVC